MFAGAIGAVGAFAAGGHTCRCCCDAGDDGEPADHLSRSPFGYRRCGSCVRRRPSLGARRLGRGRRGRRLRVCGKVATPVGAAFVFTFLAGGTARRFRLPVLMPERIEALTDSSPSSRISPFSDSRRGGRQLLSFDGSLGPGVFAPFRIGRGGCCRAFAPSSTPAIAYDDLCGIRPLYLRVSRAGGT